MDILCDQESSANPTAKSLIQINHERRLYRNVYGAGEINASHLFNLTVDSENLTNVSSESSTTPPCYSSLFQLSQKNWPALLTVIVIVLTIAGNILVIMAVSLEKKLQNATNYFLMSLAIADMLLGFLVMPVSMLTILYGYAWPLPRKLCAIWIYLDVLFSTASIMHLCAISLDRYIAIRNPIHHSRFNSRTKAFAKIIAVWTISVDPPEHWQLIYSESGKNPHFCPARGEGKETMPNTVPACCSESSSGLLFDPGPESEKKQFRIFMA